MRVLLISTHPVQYAAPQYRQLAADPRIDVTVAFLSLHGREGDVDPEFGIQVTWDVPLLEGYGWVQPRNWAPRPGIRGFFGLVNPGLWREIRRGAYDVVVCFGYRALSFWIAAAAAKVTRSALVWTTDATGLGPREGRAWKAQVKAFVLPLIFRSGTAALAPSSRSAAFIRSLGVRADRVFVTPYVVDNAFFASRAAHVDVAEVRRGWGIPADAVVAAFVGKLVAWKRPGDLIGAVAEIPALHAVIAGEGPQREELERLTVQLAVEDRVRFLGFRNQTELPAVYAAADVLVLPSEYEPFGLVVNEAFASGTPAIVSETCGSAGDLIREGETGFVFPPGDVDALSGRLRQVAADGALREALAQGARARIDEWGPEAALEAIVDAFGRIGRSSRVRRSGT